MRSDPGMDRAGPDRVGDWVLGEALGQGGAGVVFAATHHDTGVHAAVKLAHREAGTVRNHWFQREAGLAARLRHPNIVALIEWGFEDDRPYLVYERVDGPDLEEVANSLTLDEIIRLGGHLLAALGYAHDAGVVHCDVTPSNVMVDERGVAKLTDFGLARARNESGTRRLGGHRLISGTPGYLSPEQATGVGSPGPASDLFGCGAVLYRMLSGDAPYSGQTAVEIVEKTLSIAPAPMRPRSGLRAPAGLREVVERLLARDPGKRYSSAARAAAAWHEASKTVPARAGSQRPPALSEPGLQSMQTMLAQDVQRASPGDADGFSTQRASPARVTRRTTLGGKVERLRRPRLAEAVLHALGTDLGRVVSVVGPRGAGLDDVPVALRAKLEERGVRTCFVRGRLGGACAPFQALAGVVLDSLGASHDDSLRRAIERLVEGIRATGLEDTQWGRDALVGGLLGVGPTGAMSTAVMEAYAVCDAILDPDRRPVVIVVADADGVDSGTTDVIRALTERATGGVGAVLLRNVSQVGPDEVRIDAEVPDAGSLDDLWDRLCPGAPEPRPAADSSADLAPLAAAVSSRNRDIAGFVRDLAPYPLALLRAAAAFGGDVPKRGAQAMARGFTGEDDDREALSDLSQRGILTETQGSCARQEPWLRLESPALAEHLLGELPEATRREFFAAAAQWLCRYCLDDSAINQARVATLAAAAGLAGSAAYALTEAARIELESGRLQSAAPYLDRATALAVGDAADAIDHARAHRWLAEAALAAGRTTDADTHVAAALAVIEDGRPVMAAKLLHCRADAAVQAGNLEAGLGYLEEALNALGEVGDPMELARVHSLMGWVLGYRLGRNEEGITHGQRALDVAARISAPAFRASLCGRLGANYLRAGDWDGQLETNRKDLALSTAARDTAGIVRAHINIGVCLHNRGFLDLARQHTEEARDLAQRVGAAGARQIADNNLAMIALDDGRGQDVEGHVAAIFETAARIGHHRAFAETHVTVARLATRRGDYDSAAESLTRAAEVSDVADLEVTRRAGALLELARGNAAAASAQIDQVLSTEAHDPYERALSQITHGAVLRALSNHDEAARVEADADRLFMALGADPRLERRRWGGGDVHEDIAIR
ncbi:MAG: protein kinase [Deltaproteobacteria bacterium]|nr:protein kinase [Deltaproteobacteria bacterium]